MANDKFYYFGFASNMNSKRMRSNVSEATFVSLGLLQNHRLVFRGESSIWHGATANLQPEEGSSVWGVIWQIPSRDLPDLDRQEGVLNNLYRNIHKEVVTPGGNSLKCLLYESTQEKKEGLPSQTYLQTIIDGAQENKLPEEYINSLKSTKTNAIIHDFPGNKENIL